MNKSEALPHDQLGTLNATILLTILAICAFIALFGIIGNIALIIKYKRNGLNVVRCQHLMLTLAIFDLTFLLTIPCVLTSFYFLTTDDIDTTLFNITYILMQFAWKGSVFTTVAITLHCAWERDNEFEVCMHSNFIVDYDSPPKGSENGSSQF